MSKTKAKRPQDSAFNTRKIVGPDHLNPNGTLFGGVIMSWIDEVAFMTARRHSGRAFVVTANIDNITFLTPLRLGDHVILTSSVNYVGRSSMEIGVKVEKENPFNGSRVRATSAYLTFVALNKRGIPRVVPPLNLETLEDQRRFEEAKLRIQVRARMRRRLKRKLAASQFDPHTVEHVNSLTGSNKGTDTLAAAFIRRIRTILPSIIPPTATLFIKRFKTLGS
jgi:acyl-CoA hydrolase